MCIHPEIVRLNTGWYCPDCKQTFEKKPDVPKITFLNTEEEKPVEEKPKPKRTRKPKDTKAE